MPSATAAIFAPFFVRRAVFTLSLFSPLFPPELLL